MAGRPRYTEAEKARIFVVLTANDGNIKRTAREMNTPENTVRRWRDEWKQNGPPQQELVQQAVDTTTSDMVRVRDKALSAIETKLDSDPNLRLGDLNTVFGTLTDKLLKIQGLDTQRVDVQHHLPPAEELRELLDGFRQAAIEVASSRQGEIVEARVIEPKALPA